jgi:hypothetical protein
MKCEICSNSLKKNATSSICATCRRRITKRNYTRRLKEQVIAHYGGVCACCGIDAIEFLSIDHIYGGGTAHRRELNIGGGTPMYIWLQKQNYPKGFRVLCHNCNQCYGAFGYCYHQIERGELEYGSIIYHRGERTRIIQ